MITQSPLAMDIPLLHANACSISKVILTYTKQAAGSDRWALISAVPLFRRCALQVIHASPAARPNTQHHSYLAWLGWKKCATHSLPKNIYWMRMSGALRYGIWFSSQCILQFSRNITMVLILTEEFAVDLGSVFAMGKADCLLYVTSNRCLPVTNTLGWSAAVFCACEIVRLFSIVFCVVRAVRKRDFGLL